MAVYNFNIILVIFLVFLGEIFIPERRDRTNYKIAKIAFFLMLFLEFALVGDWTTDIRQYYLNFMVNYGSFNEVKMSLSIANLYNTKCVLFVLILALIKLFTSNFIWVLIFWGAIISLSYIHFIYKNSELTWMSMLVLLASGTYYYSSNLIRQVVVASLFCFCIDFLFEKKWKPYFVIVFVLSLIHLSSLVLIPVYFLLQINFSKRTKQTIILISLILVLVYVFTPQITEFITRYFYSEYHINDSNGLSLYSSIKTILLSGVIFLNSNKFDFNKTQDKVIFNGCVFYAISAVASFKIAILYRFTFFFVPFLMLAYPYVTINCLSFNKRKLIMALFLIILHLNFSLAGEYYFFWDNLIYHWNWIF